MKLTIDTEARLLQLADGDGTRELPLYDQRAFELLSDLWLKLSWVQKYSYTFTWMGRPIIQHPEDLVRLQEAIYFLKPDVIIETGVAHGGSLVLSASLMKAAGRGRSVVGVDLEIRPHNRAAIEAHELASMIKLIEGDSASAAVVARVSAEVRAGDVVLVILDSNHSREHVRRELEAYAPLVSQGSWILATDGIMQSVWDAPRGQPSWRDDNPAQAARDFAAAHPEFAIEPPPWRFNESALRAPITCWPDAWLRRRA
ncbi:MAG: cephalosporin hydroxylase family protein [Betaproteobacteria bacterium]